MYREIYNRIKQVQPTRDPDALTGPNIDIVVPYEGGAMREQKAQAQDKRAMINAAYKQAAQELGITQNYWNDKRVADRAYQLMVGFGKQNSSPNSSVKPGELNPEAGVYVEYQRPSTVKPGGYNDEAGVYVEYVKPAVNLSDLYARNRDAMSRK